MTCDSCLDGLHVCTNPRCDCACNRRSLRPIGAVHRRPLCSLDHDDDLAEGVLALLRRLYDDLRESKRVS